MVIIKPGAGCPRASCCRWPMIATACLMIVRQCNFRGSIDQNASDSLIIYAA
jgi:hypothetical protein